MVSITLLLNTCDQGTGEPSASEAKYLVTADQRIYFTNDYSQGVDKFGEYVTLIGYWTSVNGSWEYVNKELYLSYRGFKDVKVQAR
jgi:hypothetical protein